MSNNTNVYTRDKRIQMAGTRGPPVTVVWIASKNWIGKVLVFNCDLGLRFLWRP